MARGRLISKSLGSSRKYHQLLTVGGKVGEFSQVLFPLIVANTDDFGRMAGDAFTVKNLVLPSSRRPEADFDRALQALQTVGLIVRYQVNGSIYLQVNQFDAHQPNLHKRTKSSFPEIPENAGDSVLTELNLTESKRTQKGTQNRASSDAQPRDLFAEFWARYPKKKAKEDAQRAWMKRQPSPELLSVMLSALERQRHSPDWLKDGGRYIPLPARWLNGSRWLDEELPESDVSETMRHNLAASDEAERLILEAEARRGHRG